MCYYKLWVYDLCGHSVMGSTPVTRCANAQPKRTSQGKGKSPALQQRSEYHPLQQPEPPSRDAEFIPGSNIKPLPLPPTHETRLQNQFLELGESSTQHQHCTSHLIHPFQSYLLHSLCSNCTRLRSARISEVESGNEVRFEDWRWKVKYLSPVPEEARHAGSSNKTGNRSATGWVTGPGDWGEAMGSWVRGKGLEIGLGEFLGGGGEERGEDSRERDKWMRGTDKDGVKNKLKSGGSKASVRSQLSRKSSGSKKSAKEEGGAVGFRGGMGSS